MSERITLEELISKYQEQEWIDCTFMDAFDGDEFQAIMYYLKENKQLKEKYESKLKMMEISFEQINNSRNDMIKQLSNVELQYDNLKEKLEKIKKHVFHAGCNGNPDCVYCKINKILG